VIDGNAPSTGTSGTSRNRMNLNCCGELNVPIMDDDAMIDDVESSRCDDRDTEFTRSYTLSLFCCPAMTMSVGRRPVSSVSLRV
jgi:hypothetical protein